MTSQNRAERLIAFVGRDQRTTKTDVVVVMAVAAQLVEAGERFVPVKATGLHESLGVQRNAVARSLRRLAKLGYLERGPRVPGRAWTFRVPLRAISPHYDSIGRIGSRFGR